MSKPKKNVPSGWDANSPGIEEVASRLRFSLEKAEIWLDEERMVLMHSSAMACLRKELIATLGVERARGLLTRMGYASGVRDAELARKRYPSETDLELLHKGPLLHALEGIVKVEPLILDIDIEHGHYYCEALWKNSFEGYIHDKLFGTDGSSVCWTEVGYATGYVSGIMGRFILHKEVECGLSGCRFIGKPVDQWDTAEDEIKYYKEDSVVEEILLLQDQVEELRSAMREPVLATDMVGESPAFKKAWSLAERAARSTVTVLLLGETGVGKELFAHAVHQASSRAGKPFVAVNCGALPNELIESELFGVEKGAFTGAQASRPGRFERADGGTLFLDEVGELSLNAQTRLLRVLQEGEIDRLGGTATRKVDVRVVAATNVDLSEAIKQGRFRKDLYYRLNVYPVTIPPLRERKEDIPLLAERFLAKFSTRESKRVRGITDKARHALLAYDWPGNVRELENVIERGIILAQENCLIDVSALFASVTGASMGEKTTRLSAEGALSNSNDDTVNVFLDYVLNSRLKLEDIESVLLSAAVKRSNGNLSSAARLLGISRAQVAYRLKRHGGAYDESA